ncbi:MAG: amino acid adenylation domain-containing protein [Clostridiales bacterium]|nr:amino acid adenylation domain-containing protein [Clostridiales bacterium]
MNRYPLTKTEYGIYIEQMTAQNTAYNNPLTMPLPDEVDIERLRQAVRTAAAAHPYLKTGFDTDENGEVCKYVRCCCEVEAEVIKTDRFDVKDFVKLFDLRRDLLCRFSIIITPERKLFFSDVHHIIYDGASLGILLRQIADAYLGLPVEAESFTANDLALEEKERTASGEFAEAREYYMSVFDGVDTDSELFCDANPREHRVMALEYDLQRVDSSGLKRLAKKHGVKLSTVFNAAFACLLSKHTGSSSVLYSTVHNGRDARLANTVGMFVKTYPVLAEVSEEKTVADFLAELDSEIELNRRYDLYSYADFCAETGLHPTVLFAYQGDMLQKMDFCGAEATPTYYNAIDSKDGFEMTVWRYGERFTLHADYSMDRYNDEVVKAMCESLDKILSDMLGCETLGGIDMLTDAQLQALDGYNENERAFDGGDIVTMFRARAAEAPDSAAVVCGDVRLTYRELDRLSENLAAFLKNRGIGREDVVSILIPRCEYMAAAPLGVLKCGAGYQPLDPSYPTERLDFMMKDANAKYLIADRGLMDRVPGCSCPVIYTDEITSLPDAEKLDIVPGEHDLFIMLYTSGSTGVPKGVMLEHGNLKAFCSWFRDYYSIDGSSRAAAYASFGFDANMMDTYPTLTAGAELHIIEEDIRLDMLAIRDYFSKNKITHSFMTTQVGRQYAELFPDAEYPHYLSVGGEKLVPVEPPKTYGLYNCYGPTECTVFVNHFKVDRIYERVPIGPTLNDLKQYVVDKHMRRLPVGVPGELIVAGPQVGRGYLNRPEQNEKAFIKNPFCGEPGYERAYRTGDVVRMLPGGVVDFVGRNDGQVKIRGFRIELSEVEGIIRKFPGIKDATVQAFDEQGGGKFIAAYVVSDEQVDISALNAFIAKNKPPYMVPAVTMQIDRIPLNQNQKVNKRALPVPEKKAEEVVPPKNETQRRIFELAAGVIGSRAFGVNTDLFAAGLTSIGAIKLNVLLSKEFGVPVSIGDLKENGTVEALEQFLAGGEASEQYEVLSDYPLSETQNGILVECISKPDSTVYSIPYLFKLSPKVDLERLKKALEDTINAHPYLKIKLFVDDDGEIRVCRDDPKLPVAEITETDSLPDPLVTPFELFGGRLYRMIIYKTPEANYLFLELHHIICDGTSEAILIEDINSAYAGNEIETEKYTGFEAVLDEKKARESEKYEKAAAYHRDMLEGVDHDFLPPKDVRGEKPATGSVTLVSGLDMGRIKEFCRINKFTVNAFFNAAFGLLISKYNFKNEALYVTIYNGRNDSRLARSVTMLVKTLPVHTEIDGGKPVKEFISAVGEQIMNSMANDVFSFAEISRAYEIPMDIMFVYQGESFTFDSVGGEPAESIPLALSDTKAPISFYIFEKGGKAEFQFEYRSDMYSERFMRAFSEYFEKAAAELMTRELIKEVSILTESTKERISGFNATEGPVPETTVNRIFEAEAARHPDRTAVIAMGERLTYRELNEHSNRIAHALMREGVKPDDMVGLMVPRIVYAYAGREGILKSGGAFLMLAPDYPDDRVQYIIENSEAKLVVTMSDIAKERAELFERCGLKVLVIEELIKSGETENPDPAVAPHNIAYCLYTSGSTGKPKGVMIEHHSLVNFVTDNPCNLYASGHLKDSNVTLSFAALTFDVSVFEHTTGLYGGKTVVIATEEEIHNPNLMAKLIIENGVEAAFFSPSYASNLLDFPEAVEALRGMKSLILGGEALPAPLYRRMRALGINAEIYNGYGPTETTIFITVDHVTDDNITIGGPVGNTKLAIFDKFDNELPPYVPGELILCGNNVGRGYVKLDKMNAEKYISFEGLPAYRSGDLSRWSPEGKIMFMGRMDNQVKLRGLRIELDEIENVMNTYPGMLRSLVLVKETEREGQFLCAYFTAEDKVDIQALKAHIGKSLAKYMIPSVYMQLDSIPMNKNGKIDKKALPEPVAEGVKREIKRPANELESKIVGIFAKALGHKEMSTDDDFFENGGTSLSASKVAMLALSMNLPIAYKDVFEYPTAEAMAKHIGVQDEAPAPEIKHEAPRETHENSLRFNTAENVDEISEARPFGRVLLAGATGFLGSHVFKKLLERGVPVVALCRSGELDPDTRLRAMMAYYFDSPLDDEISRLVKTCDADITSEGLDELLKDERIDTIINCAACVKHFAKDDIIERINVGGVINLIELAKAKNARFIQISTLSVAGEDVDNAIDPSFRLPENMLDFGQDISNKYVHSKYMAEKAVLEAIDEGLDAKIIRVGNLMGRQSDGEFQINSVTNSFIRSLKAYRVLGCFPVSSCDQTVDFSPIDEVAETIMRLSLTDKRFTLFHCANAHEVQMGDVIVAMNNMGFKIDIVHDPAFTEKLNEAIADESRSMLVSGLLTYSSSDNRLRRYVKTDNSFSIKALYRLGYKWPITDEAYLDRVIESLDSLGFFDRDDI